MKAYDKDFSSLIAYLNYFSAATRTNSKVSFPNVDSASHADQILKYSECLGPQFEADVMNQYVFKLQAQKKVLYQQVSQISIPVMCLAHVQRFSYG